MTTPRETLQSHLQTAVKARETVRMATLRMLIAAVDNERIRTTEEVDEKVFLGLVQKAIKQRKESAELYEQGDREELAERERAEAEILTEYLPAQVSEDELRAAIEAFVQEHGLSGPQGIGPIMKEMVPRFAGRADGATLQRLARELLG